MQFWVGHYRVSSLLEYCEKEFVIKEAIFFSDFEQSPPIDLGLINAQPLNDFLQHGQALLGSHAGSLPPEQRFELILDDLPVLPQQGQDSVVIHAEFPVHGTYYRRFLLWSREDAGSPRQAQRRIRRAHCHQRFEFDQLLLLLGQLLGELQGVGEEAGLLVGVQGVDLLVGDPEGMQPFLHVDDVVLADVDQVEQVLDDGVGLLLRPGKLRELREQRFELVEGQSAVLLHVEL